MTKEISQFNIDLPTELLTRMRIEAVTQNVSMIAFGVKAFEKFLALPVAQRRAILAGNKKISGRKITA